MNKQKNLLVVHHTKSGSTMKMTAAIIKGAKKTNINIRSISALKASSADVFWCDGLILGTPENFGYMSGAMKYFLDEIYYDCLEKREGIPYAIYVKAGNDGTGAIVNIEKILSGLSFKKIQNPVLVVGDLDKIALSRCEELGHLMAVGLIEMIF